MKSGILYDQGDIVLMPLPFTDLTYAKKRPVLVLSKKEHNSKGDDFIVCGITSNLEDKDCSILIEKKDFENGFLPKPSRVKIDKIFTLEQKLAVKKFGKVKIAVLNKVKEDLFRII